MNDIEAAAARLRASRDSFGEANQARAAERKSEQAQVMAGIEDLRRLLLARGARPVPFPAKGRLLVRSPSNGWLVARRQELSPNKGVGEHWLWMTPDGSLFDCGPILTARAEGPRRTEDQVSTSFRATACGPAQALAYYSLCFSNPHDGWTPPSLTEQLARVLNSYS